MFAEKKAALTLALLAPLVGCGTDQKDPMAAYAHGVDDPITKGRELANGRDPGLQLMISANPADAANVQADLKQRGDNYLAAVEDLYGHFPELAYLVERSHLTILGVENVADAAKVFMERLGNPDGVDLPTGHETGITLTTKSSETGAVTHQIVLLSLDSVKTTSEAIKVYGHELAHIEAIDRLGVERYSKLSVNEREIAAYSTHVARMGTILSTWQKRFGAESQQVRELEAAIADHKSVLHDYQNGRR